MSGLKLGLCCSRPECFAESPAQSSLTNAVQFFQVSEADSFLGGRRLTLAQFDASATDLELGLREAAENDVTHVLFLSPRTLLPVYAIQSLLAMGVSAVSGISWTWMPGQAGDSPEIFPRLGYFDPEGRPFPYFGWCAPNLFEVDWCGLDCLLLSREALEEIAEPLSRVQGREPALRISQCLRSRGIRILIDSSIQCPRAVGMEAPPKRKLIPSEYTWREFSKDFPDRRLPRGAHYDPAYRGRAWYREWLASVLYSE